jgi:hypothetical protein
MIDDERTFIPSPSSTHFVTITDRGTKQIRGKVVFVHRVSDGHAEVHIRTSEWLDPGSYEATYVTGTQTASGHYNVIGYAVHEDGGYLFEGTFERTT